jgi:hypothetical protein
MLLSTEGTFHHSHAKHSTIQIKHLPYFTLGKDLNISTTHKISSSLLPTKQGQV